jgi:hypothetical protein
MKTNDFYYKLGEYFDAINKHGVGSEETKAIREKYKQLDGFVESADRFDRLKNKVMSQKSNDD